LTTPEYLPQKALLVDRPPAGDRWVHEIKLDGFRMGVLIDRRKIRIISRRGTDYTAEFPEIVTAARKLKTTRALLDGEIVVLDKSGVSRFQLLQQLGASRSGLTYFAFDLLSVDGDDLTRLPLVERKRRLQRLVGTRNGMIRYNPHIERDGAEVFASACALGAEGIISKLSDAPYRLGARSADWQKIKCVKRQEFVVGGFTDPSGSRVGVGSILIGYYEGDSLKFAGKCGTGTGWSAAFSLDLKRKLEKLAIAGTPFDPPPAGWLRKNAHWVKPKLIVEVEFTEWTSDGRVRHPSLKGFRSDKSPREVGREREAHLKEKNTEVMVFPRIHVTASDLAGLYTEIAEWALPHLEGRPLTLVRATKPITREDALRTQAKFIHHTKRDQAFVPDVVPRTRIVEKEKTGEYCYIDSVPALKALIEVGVIEIHAWNARVSNVERPDRVVFDIDPGDGVAWADVVAAARRLRRILQTLGLESWVKTTGGKGLHVVAPFRAEHDWEGVFEFSRAVATQMTEEDEHYILSFEKAARRGKLLIDYKRNYRTSIAVAGFSTRAKPTGAMSIPVKWEELAGLSGSDQWTVANIAARLRRLRSDPWKGYWSSRQRLKF
jgi:bifunctional non-homologous end joining protein LigD